METAVVVREYGGPEQLVAVKIPAAKPGPGEIRIRQKAVGVNFHDVYVRSGLYRTLALPGIPGIEGAGEIDSVGSGVTGFSVGDRVAYVSPQYGAYASSRILPASQAVRLPDSMSFNLAATTLLKGLTAEMLLFRARQVKKGDWVLIHAAAGGVGGLLCQWASRLGAILIGTVGSEEKAAAARQSGCSHIIFYRNENVAERVMEITQSRGVDVVYDSVGKDTFDASLASLAVFGHLVNFGQSSGAVAPFQISRLAAKSNAVLRPILFHYIHERSHLETMAANLFDVFARGIVEAREGKPYPLELAGRAHADLEARVSGPFILTPAEAGGESAPGRAFHPYSWRR